MEIIGKKILDCNEPIAWKPGSIDKFAEEIGKAILEFKKMLSLPKLEVWIEPGRFIASMPVAHQVLGMLAEKR